MILDFVHTQDKGKRFKQGLFFNIYMSWKRQDFICAPSKTFVIFLEN